MILAINKETGTEITFDTLQQFEMAQTWGSYEIKNEKHEPVNVIKVGVSSPLGDDNVCIGYNALNMVTTGNKLAIKKVVEPVKIESEFIKDEPIKVNIPDVKEEVKPKKKGRPAKK
jgi:hypothetical protein